MLKAVDSRTSNCGRQNHGDPECNREFFSVYIEPPLSGFIRHVQRQSERNTRFGELDRQKNGASQVLRVPYLQHSGQCSVEQDPNRRLLIFGARRKGQDAGRIYERVVKTAPGSPDDLNRRSRIVGRYDSMTGERLE